MTLTEAAPAETAAVYSSRVREWHATPRVPVCDALSAAEQAHIEVALARHGTIAGAMAATGHSYEYVQGVLHDMQGTG